MIEGWREEGSGGKGTCCAPWRPQFNPYLGKKGRQRELTLQCALSSTCSPWHSCLQPSCTDLCVCTKVTKTNTEYYNWNLFPHLPKYPLLMDSAINATLTFCIHVTTLLLLSSLRNFGAFAYPRPLQSSPLRQSSAVLPYLEGYYVDQGGLELKVLAALLSKAGIKDVWNRAWLCCQFCLETVFFIYKNMEIYQRTVGTLWNSLLWERLCIEQILTLDICSRGWLCLASLGREPLGPVEAQWPRVGEC